MEAEEETVPEVAADVIVEEAEVTLEAPQEVADVTLDVSAPAEGEFTIQPTEDTEADFKVSSLHYQLPV